MNAYTRADRFPNRGLRRGAFVLYALVLVTATHWPQVKIEGPIPRPDLVIHFTAYGVWTLLFLGCAWFGPVLSGRNRAWSGGVGLCYAVVDELTQGLPGLHRVVALDDALANMCGVIIAVVGASVLAERLGGGAHG